MLLALSESFSDSLELGDTVQATCDVALSQALIDRHAEDAQSVFRLVCQALPTLWQHLMPHVADNKWIASVQTDERQLHLSVLLVTNPEIQCLNSEFRGKNTPTDVLTFTLLDDAMVDAGMDQLPELSLGEVYVSLEWIREAVCNEIEANPAQKVHFSESVVFMLLDRIVHGCLHLLGVHHDTMSAYNKVVEIQRLVVQAVTEKA